MDDVLVDRIDSTRKADVVLPNRPVIEYAGRERLASLRVAEIGTNPQVEIGHAAV